SFVAEKEEKYLNIFKMNYAETSLFDVGLKPHPRFPLQEKIKVTKPLLSDLIDSTESFCRQKNISPVFYNIETKTHPATDNIYHPTPAVFINLLMAVIASGGIENRTIIQSFDIRTLQYLHLKFPNIQTALLIEGEDKRTVENQLKELGFNPTIYSPHFSLVTIDLIQKLHQQKIKIIPWTVDDAAQINRLKNLGVDGIITDDPGLF
ncbi:MAG: glycerophosphodiester phosphodiesterase family protein, partial [Ferruginibacter sp.]